MRQVEWKLGELGVLKKIAKLEKDRNNTNKADILNSKIHEIERKIGIPMVDQSFFDKFRMICAIGQSKGPYD